MTNEELIQHIKTETDKETRDTYLMELFSQNEGLASIIYNRNFRERMQWDDFKQESFIAMTKAVKSFDASRNKFSSWYGKYIGWHVSRYLKDTGTLVRLPVYVWADLGAMDEQERMPMLNIAFQKSLDAEMGDARDSYSLLDKVADPVNYSDIAIDRADQDGLKEVFSLAMADLPVRWQDILQRRFVDGQTLDEVGEFYGISRERVRQIQTSAISKLKKGKYVRQLETFLSA